MAIKTVIFKAPVNRIIPQKYQLRLILAMCVTGLWLAACRHSKQVKTPGTAKVMGIVTQTSPYCGGARPSDELLQETNRPRPYPGKTLFLQKANSPLQESIKTVTNDSGWFFVSVTPGEYLLWQAEQLEPQPPAALRKTGLVMVDSLCLERWKKQPLARLNVTTGTADTAKLNFHHPCFISGDVPCRRYVGPMPP